MNNLKRIMNSKKLQNLKLLVNIEIQETLVKSVTVIDSHAFVNSLKGGEIVISSFYTIEDKLNVQISFIKLLKRAGCAALIIKHTDSFKEVSKEVIDYAEQIEFPIYEVTNNLVYSEIISNIIELVFATGQSEYIKGEYICNILYSDLFDVNALEKWGKDLGCTATEGFTSALYIYIKEFIEKPNEPNPNLKYLKYKFENQLTMIINKLYSYKKSNRIGMFKHYNGFSIFPSHDSIIENKCMLERMERYILNMCKEQFPKLKVYIGISNIYPGLSGIRDGFKEAEFAIKAGQILHKNNPVFNYADYEVYDLFYKLHSETSLNFAKKTLGVLFENEILMETIWTYFNYNENLQDSSKALNLHPNTLKYRLNKIRELTNLDERKIDDKFKLYLAALEYYIFAS